MITKSYQIIKDFYADKTAARSGVPLINHIDEGLHILNFIGAKEITKDAYCIHPVLQSDESFVTNKSFDFSGVNTESIILAMEYRRVANSYLSHNNIEDFVGFSCNEIRQMLIADKVQNYKDFMLHHYNTHARRDDLFNYFLNWFDLLEIHIYDDEYLDPETFQITC